MRKAVEQDHVHALGADAGRIKNLTQGAPVLPLQIIPIVRGAPVSVGTDALDFRKSHRIRDRRRDIDMARRDAMTPWLNTRPEENQWCARLNYIERAMLSGLDAVGV